MADPTVPNPMVPPTPAPFMAPTPTMPPVPPAKRGLSLRSPVVAGIAGLVVGALAAGVPLALSGSSSPFGADKGALKAPAAIGGYTPMAQNPKTDATTVKRLANSEPISAKNLSAAYGGAAAVVKQYSDSGLENFFELEAVRAQSPTPFQPYEDAHALGLDKPEQEIVTFGQVACLIANQPGPEGQPAPANSSSAITCERTAAHLTVRLRFGGGGDLQHSPQQAAALVDTAWNSLS